MAVPALVGRRGWRPSVSSEAAVSPPRVRRFGRGHTWIVLALAIAALFSRVYTTNSLAGEPTNDEYLYAVHARDLARDWSAGESVSLDDLGVEGRSVAVESPALPFLFPCAPLTLAPPIQP